MMYVDILSTDRAILFLKIESTYGTSVAIVVNAFLARFRVSIISVYPNLTRSSLVEILPIFDFVRSIQKVRCLTLLIGRSSESLINRVIGNGTSNL